MGKSVRAPYNNMKPPNNNCKLVKDGTIMTTNKIYPDQEFLEGYNAEEDRPPDAHDAESGKQNDLSTSSKKLLTDLN
jgi:hypothetical protein